MAKDRMDRIKRRLQLRGPLEALLLLRERPDLQQELKLQLYYMEVLIIQQVLI